MRGAVLYAPGDVRVEERQDPGIIEPTDAVIRLSATCVCGSDLWPYRGIQAVEGPSPMGHEYVGVVQEVGSEVATVRPGQFVVGSFLASDNTCELCQAGYQSACINGKPIGANGAQAEYLRVPLADGTLVATPDIPSDDLVLSLLAASDVLGTGWFGAVAAEAGPGRTVAVVGDGAVGLLAVLAASLLGAERIIAMSRHAPNSSSNGCTPAPASGRPVRLLRPRRRLPSHRQRGRGQALRHEHPLQPPAPGLHHPAPGRRRLDRRGRPGPSYLDPGSGGPENDFTNRNTTFATWNLLHLGAMLKRSGGIPAHGNQRSEWDAGCRFDADNPEHR